MSTKPGPKKKKQNKKHDWSFYAIIISAIILAIPAAMMGVSALSAYFASNSPILGTRFENQYDNVITSDDQKTLKTNLVAMENVTDVQIELITGTLRVYVNTDEALAKDSYDGLMTSVYDAVIAQLPLDAYFTKDDTYHRYDLEIHLFNMKNPTEETRANFLYYQLVKSSLISEPQKVFVSEPLSQEFVDQLWKISNDLDKWVEEQEKAAENPVEPEVPEETPEAESENPETEDTE